MFYNITKLWFQMKNQKGSSSLLTNVTTTYLYTTLMVCTCTFINSVNYSFSSAGRDCIFRACEGNHTRRETNNRKSAWTTCFCVKEIHECRVEMETVTHTWKHFI